MSFMHQEVKYRGQEPVLNWSPSHAQPRPGLLEASQCVKRMHQKPKVSIPAVLSCSSDGGIQCVDAVSSPIRKLMAHTVYEIAHCGLDLNKPKLVTCIVGTKHTKTDFFCHVFKCDSKDQAARIVKAVAQSCTQAYQRRQQQQKKVSPQPQRSQTMQQPVRSNVTEDRVKAHIRSSIRRRTVSGPTRQGKPNPQLTDSWFRPSMLRGEVNSILRAGQVGDFIIRESQSRANSYAIAVQIGSNIWTALIISVPTGGFQLGEKGGVTFNTLPELVLWYSEKPIMNNASGYPMTLRLPQDTQYIDEVAPTSSPARQPSTRIAHWRESTRGGPASSPSSASTGARRGPPIPASDSESEEEAGPEATAAEERDAFERIMNNTGPACGWPESSDEEDDGLAFVPGVRRNMSEKEAFELFLNAGTYDVTDDGQFVRLDDIEAAVVELSGDEAPTGLTVYEDSAFNVSGGPQAAATGGFSDDEDDTPAPPSAAPPSASGSNMSVEVLADAIFEKCDTDPSEMLSGASVRPILLTSGLEVNTLGIIWSEIDEDRSGWIDKDQLCLILGMISQVQQGEEPDLESLDPDTIPAPKMNF
eukprot:m.65989 g.65989  ORF g.65989 m.65989 type:complete len:587 (+) comp12086_c0_seq4:204-1964(+)